MAGGFGPPLGGSSLEGSEWRGEARVVGPPWTHLITLTIGLLGVQVFWSVEMSYGSPYLISLGFSTSHVALVFLAGPFSGLVVQPLVGAYADTSTSRFGRRRPYILVGCLLCVVGMLLLGYTRGVAGLFTTSGSSAHSTLTMILAVVAIFLIDFSINAVQAVDRALVVDTLPPSQQAAGNACAALMLGLGAVVGFFVGNLPLVSMLSFLHAESELQALSGLVSMILLGFHLVTAILVKERVLVGSHDTPRPSLRHEFREIWSNARSLPTVIRQICLTQFFAWLGWFPVLFYTTLYITDVYMRSAMNVPPSRREDTADLDEATRLGAHAQLLSSILSLATNALLPLLTAPSSMTSSPHTKSGTRQWLPQFSLPMLWAASHAIFSLCMIGSFFVQSVAGATVLIVCTGFSWGVTQWAPFSLLAEAILTSSPTPDAHYIQLSDHRSATNLVTDEEDERQAFLVAEEDEEESDEDAESVETATPTKGMGKAQVLLGNSLAQMSVVDVTTPRLPAPEPEIVDVEPRAAAVGGLGAKAGVILGIHNIFIVIPQFLITGFSAIVFAVLDGGQKKGRNSVVYIFRIGAIWGAIAFVLAWRLARELRRGKSSIAGHLIT
ncbi:unnamed protein product [Mycena citricolor]|uniref:MFS general substrate transporter n=1 Tax=Mycena citricolor TaxID=2018698 RepID=A0AAD2HX56_9AGAR|nr:unnamed protein product [Mycena citricolor]